MTDDYSEGESRTDNYEQYNSKLTFGDYVCLAGVSVIVSLMAGCFFKYNSQKNNQQANSLENSKLTEMVQNRIKELK